jgi:hypothetical protein
MNSFDSHPTVAAVRSKASRVTPSRIDTAVLRQWCLAAGADDVGFVNLDRAELDGEREDILRVFPATKSLICFVWSSQSMGGRAVEAQLHSCWASGETQNRSALIVCV